MLKIQVPTFCEDRDCTRSECCNEADSCHDSDCGTASVIKADPPAFCAGSDCAQEECCDMRGECTEGICGLTKLLREGRSVYCKGPTCTSDECCEPRGECGASHAGPAFDCGLGFTLKPHVTEGPPAYKTTESGWCDDTFCELDECCEDACMLATDSCQSLEGCATALQAMQHLQQPYQVLEHMYAPCGGCEKDVCSDRTSLTLLWQVATQCANALVPTKCIPQRDLEAFVNDLAGFGDEEVCWFVSEMQMVMTSDWALHGCPTPMKAPAPEKRGPSSTHGGTASPCHEARVECTSNDGCRGTVAALHDATPSLKIQAALGLCSTPQAMFMALNVYSRCPDDLGVTLPCFDAMAEDLASAHGGATDASVCDAPELPTMHAVYGCTGASPPTTAAPAEAAEDGLTGCALAVATCAGDAACGPSYQASLAADSLGKTRLLLEPCASAAAVNAMLDVALECADFLPCGDCVPCEIVGAMKEVIGEMPEAHLCAIGADMTQSMVEHMEAIGCPNVPAGVYSGPSSRRLRLPSSPVFEWPSWLREAQAKHTPALTV